MPTNLPKIQQVTELAQTRNFRIEAVDLCFSNGQERTYERLANKSNGAVLIIAHQPDDTFLMIREYAVGMEHYELTLPKGKIDDGESVLAAAQRELIEETGFAARQLTHIDSLSLASGYSSHLTHVVLAEDLYNDSADGDEPEPLEVLSWPFQSMHKLIEEAECTEARTFAALYICQQYLLTRSSSDI